MRKPSFQSGYCLTFAVLVTSLLTLPAPIPAYALRAQELVERDPSARAGVEADLAAEQRKKLVGAALDRIRQGDPSVQKLLQGVSIVPVSGRGVRVEGDRVFLGVAPGRDAKVLAELLTWAGAAHRAVQAIETEAKRVSELDPPKSQRLRAIHGTLQQTPILLHTGEATTLYEGKVHLRTGSHVGVKEMVKDLVKAGNDLSKAGHPREEAVLLGGSSADDLALGLWKEGDTGAAGASSEAWAEGAAAGKADERKQVHEPEMDSGLLARVKLYAGANPDGLQGAWRAYADDLNKIVRLNDRDRQTQFMEQLFNVYGFVHYSERSAGVAGETGPGAAALNSASESARLLAKALVDYLNDPFLGQRGDKAQQELLAEIAQGIHEENLLSYLRFGHIPMFLAAKISKPMVSAQIANERMTQGPAGGKAASPLSLTLKGTVHGLLASGSAPHQLLAIAGPAGADSAAEPFPSEYREYLPELPLDAGYRLGATGLIEEWQEAMGDAGSLDEAAKRIPNGLAGNLDLALSRPNEQTPRGTDEPSELLLFYFSLGSSAVLQKSWRPFLKDVDLKALSKEQGRTEADLVAGLFVWQTLRAYLQKKKDDSAQGTILNSLAALGKSRDKIFRFIADFYGRFEEADRSRRQVAEAADQERRAQVASGKQAAQKRRRDKAAEEFADMGIPLAPAGTPFSGGAVDARLLNAVTLEGFIYRIHQLDLSSEQVQRLNVDKDTAQGVMTTLFGGHGEGAKALKKAWRNLVQALHPDRIGVSPPKYLEGQVGDKTVAAFLYNFLIPFDGFPDGRWWAKDKVGTALKQVKEALPDFTAARAEQEAARADALEDRMRKLEQVMEKMAADNRLLLRRVEELEKRAGVPTPATAGMEAVQATLLSAADFSERYSRQIASLDLDLRDVQQVLELRGTERSMEPPVWTVHLYFHGEGTVGEALQRQVAGSPIPGIRFVVESLPAEGSLEGPALVLRQGPLGREVPAGMAVVDLPETAAAAVAAVIGMDPALLAAAAYEPKLWAAVTRLRVQARRFQDDEDEWVLAFFL